MPGRRCLILCGPEIEGYNMKKLFVPATLALFASLLLSGCIVVGNRSPALSCGTLGQQLIDLQKAKNAGAISEAEFQTQKSKLLKKCH